MLDDLRSNTEVFEHIFFFFSFLIERLLALRFTKMGRLEPHGVLVFFSTAGKIAACFHIWGKGASSPCSLCKSSIRCDKAGKATA